MQSVRPPIIRGVKMVEKKKQTRKKRVQAPSLDPAARENQLVSLAIDLAAKQLKEGTASPSVITHFLKMATQRDKLEMQMLNNQSKLTKAKAESIVKSEDKTGLYTKAIEALRDYGSDDKKA